MRGRGRCDVELPLWETDCLFSVATGVVGLSCPPPQQVHISEGSANRTLVLLQCQVHCDGGGGGGGGGGRVHPAAPPPPIGS